MPSNVIRVACPKYRQVFSIPQSLVGRKNSLELAGVDGKAKTTLYQDHDEDIPEVELLEEEEIDDEPYSRRNEKRRDGNLVRRYVRWAGMRSVIFQSLFVAWTALVFFGGIGLMFAATAKNARTRQEQDAQAIVLGIYSCCSLGFYLFGAFPLGVAAIATLETRKKRKKRSFVK